MLQHHQKEIFSAILTEYTDWASVARHPVLCWVSTLLLYWAEQVTTRDNTLEALSDGLYVAPAIETADYHASLNKNSWLYVFDYQTKYGDYKTVSSVVPLCPSQSQALLLSWPNVLCTSQP